MQLESFPTYKFATTTNAVDSVFVIWSYDVALHTNSRSREYDGGILWGSKRFDREDSGRIGG